MQTISVLIVDDEPLAREGIKQLLKSQSGITLVGECADGFNAIELIGTYLPDLIFLDIEMPEMDGFDVLSELPPDYHPAVIFVTAFNQYAVDAFSVNALDYLLKPVDPERFTAALDRAREHLALKATAQINEKFFDLIRLARARDERPRRILVRTPNRIFFVETREIDWIESAGDYVWVHARGEKHLIRETMNDMEARLATAGFIRIHRSTIVNTDRIQELQPLFKGDYVVLLKNGKKLPLGKTYREKVLSSLNQ